MDDDYHYISTIKLSDYIHSVSLGYTTETASASARASTSTGDICSDNSVGILKQVEVDFPRTTIDYNFVRYKKLSRFLRDLQTNYGNNKCYSVQLSNVVETVTTPAIAKETMLLPLCSTRSLMYMVLMLTTQTCMYPIFLLLHNIFTRPEKSLYVSDFSQDNKLKIIIYDSNEGITFTYHKKFHLFNVEQAVVVYTLDCKFSFCLPYNRVVCCAGHDTSNSHRCILEWTIHTETANKPVLA